MIRHWQNRIAQNGIAHPQLRFRRVRSNLQYSDRRNCVF